MQYFRHALPDAEQVDRLVSQALAILTTADEDDLIREYAVLTLGYHAARPDVEAVLMSLLHRAAEDGDVRSAAFQVLSGAGNSHERRERFRMLLNDPYLGDEVRTYFR